MPPPSLTEIAYSHLQPSINLGLDESKFWEMTIAEIIRYQEGAIWRMKQKAQFDYALANLIGISSARMMSSDVNYPPIEDAYPNLFEKTKEEDEPEDIVVQNSVNRFMEFALRHNAMMKGENKEA